MLAEALPAVDVELTPELHFGAAGYAYFCWCDGYLVCGGWVVASTEVEGERLARAHGAETLREQRELAKVKGNRIP